MNNESNLAQLFVNTLQLKCFIDECQLPTHNLNSVQNVHQLRKYRFLHNASQQKCRIRLINPMANRFCQDNLLLVLQPQIIAR